MADESSSLPEAEISDESVDKMCAAIMLADCEVQK